MTRAIQPTLSILQLAQLQHSYISLDVPADFSHAHPVGMSVITISFKPVLLLIDVSKPCSSFHGKNWPDLEAADEFPSKHFA